MPDALDPVPLLRHLSKHRVEHLRAVKRAAGRPQDLEDLNRLGADQASD
jgi:hypothetical protein